MRWCISVGAVLVAGAIVGGDVAGIAAPSPKPRFADTKHNVPFVNVELVIAVDVSYSMDMDELAIQREGYAQAIVSKDFLLSQRDATGLSRGASPAACNEQQMGCAIHELRVRGTRL